MLCLFLTLLVAAASARDIRLELLAPPKEVEFGFCSGSPEPASLDYLTATPFPIEMATGNVITLAAQITLLEELPVGTTVDIKIVKEGLINIPFPCVEIEGQMVGSCSYNGDDILAGLELATPLATGVYGGGEPLSVTLGEIPSEIGLLLGTIRMDITIKAASGDTWACIRIRARLV